MGSRSKTGGYPEIGGERLTVVDEEGSICSSDASRSISTYRLILWVDRLLKVDKDTEVQRLRKISSFLISFTFGTIVLLFLLTRLFTGQPHSTVRLVGNLLLILVSFATAIILVRTKSSRIAFWFVHCLGVYLCLVAPVLIVLNQGPGVLDEAGEPAPYGFATLTSIPALIGFCVRTRTPTLVYTLALIVMVVLLSLANFTNADLTGISVDLATLLGNVLLILFVTVSFMDMAETLTDESIAASARTKVAEACATAEREANTTKTRFVSIMSHEVRHPLQATVLHLEMLQATALSEVQAKHVAGIATASASLLSIVNDIMDVTKLTSGTARLHSGAFELRSLVEDVVEAVTPSAVCKGLELVCCVEPSLQTSVVADAQRIRQVLGVLLSNALKFTDEGEVAVTLDSDDGDVDRWVLCVRDTGIGIASEDQEKLFREFTQVDETSTRMYGGTGLGLFITRELLHLMGGSISVSSEPGVGSTFTATFVARRSEERETPARQVAPSDVKWTIMLHAVSVAQRSTMERYVRHYFKNCEDLRIVHSTQVWTAQARLSGLVQGRSSRQRLLVVADYADCSVGLLDCLAGQYNNVCVPIMLAGSEASSCYEEWPHVAQKPLFLHTFCDVLDDVVGDPTDSSPRNVRASSLHRNSVSRQSPDRIAQIGRATVLVVDDFDLVRALVQQLLDSMGYRTIVAANGREAVDLTKQHYDDLCLILMDCEMPVLDGLTATDEIRTWEKGCGIVGQQVVPICAMTANDTTVGSARGHLITSFLTKPVRRADLETQLRTTARMPEVRGIAKRLTRKQAPKAKRRSNKKNVTE